MLIGSKRPFFWILISVFAISIGIAIYYQYQKTAEKNQIIIDTGAGSVKINAERADTPEKLASGLMNQPSLLKNSGMLFIFPDEKIRQFWMKNTLIALEIMFIDTRGHINEISTMAPCQTDASTCKIYTSKAPARFAIEVNAGFAEKNHIMEGDILEISGF